MQRIVVLNPKGGSGKTTIATNLAALFAHRERRPTLIDLDPQGSSTHWLSRRPADKPAIHGIPAFKRSGTTTRSWQMRVPEDCRTIVTDTPAAIEPYRLAEYTRGADAILVPVMPSQSDIHATAKCIADLLLIAKIKRQDDRIAIIANRVKANTIISESLQKFLDTLQIPVHATLGDSQHYVRAGANGLGLVDLPQWLVGRELQRWDRLLDWLSVRRPRFVVVDDSASSDALAPRLGQQI